MGKRCLLDGHLADAVLDSTGLYTLVPSVDPLGLPVAQVWQPGMKSLRYLVRLPGDSTPAAVEAAGG